MEQILNKLSEIELTARRIMEDADRTRASLSAEMEQECKSFDAGLEQETNREIEKLRSSLEEKKNSELAALRQSTEQALADLDAYYSRNHDKLAEELFRKLIDR